MGINITSSLRVRSYHYYELYETAENGHDNMIRGNDQTKNEKYDFFYFYF